MTIIKNNNICKKMGWGVVIFAIVMSFSLSSALALKNPSAVYCKEMGYEYIIKENEAGQMGICKFSETESCPAQEFLAGKCGEEYGYCEKEGYELKTINNPEKCSAVPFSSECAVCVLEKGEEIEVAKLMELDFKGGICGNGKCVLGENYKTCPEDCPSGSFDKYCDGMEDGLCDPDCVPETDFDCVGKLIMADVDICADKNCSQRNKVFNKDELIYLKLNFIPADLDISSTIKNPDGEIKYLVFENNLATFQSSKVGTFSLWVNFLEEGGLKSRLEKEFSYIEKTAEIPPVSICNVDGKCEGGENEQNCPQDCSPKVENKFFIYALVIAALIVAGIAALIIYKREKKNNSVYRDKTK